MGALLSDRMNSAWLNILQQINVHAAPQLYATYRTLSNLFHANYRLWSLATMRASFGQDYWPKYMDMKKIPQGSATKIELIKFKNNYSLTHHILCLSIHYDISRHFFSRCIDRFKILLNEAYSTLSKLFTLFIFSCEIVWLIWHLS